MVRDVYDGSLGVGEPRVPTILVVDDNDDIRNMVAEALTLVGFGVSTASNGKVALEQVQVTRPDLIVLDLKMPVMTGWQFMEAQRGDPELATIPVVVVTAVPDAHPAGAAALIRKPFGLDKLLATVGRLCAMVDVSIRLEPSV